MLQTYAQHVAYSSKSILKGMERRPPTVAETKRLSNRMKYQYKALNKKTFKPMASEYR